MKRLDEKLPDDGGIGVVGGGEDDELEAIVEK